VIEFDAASRLGVGTSTRLTFDADLVIPLAG
jgi:hypothetical protein